MKLDKDTRDALEKIAQAPAVAAAMKAGEAGAGTGFWGTGADVARTLKPAAEVTGEVLEAGVDLGKFEVETLMALIAAGSLGGGALAGMAASKMTEPSNTDMRKIEADLANAQVDRATAQLSRTMDTEKSLADAAKKKARGTRTLMLG